MDVSQLNNNKDSTFTWTANYKSDRSEDFALHLVDQKHETDPYEPVSEKYPADEDDRVRESRSEDRQNEEVRSDPDVNKNDEVGAQDQINPLAPLPVQTEKKSTAPIADVASTQTKAAIPVQTSGDNGDLANSGQTLAAPQKNGLVKNEASVPGNAAGEKIQTASSTPS
ncbi:MAG: hypothetical protein JKY04_07595, partial [Sneathiella sp.]|nr:hypothetical protein [Sneathiella sp.]